MLVKDQTDAEDNGVYVLVDGGAWTRAADPISHEMFVLIQSGSTNANTAWVLLGDDVIEVGVTELHFARFRALESLLPDKYVDVATLDANALLTLERTSDLPDLTVQFGTMSLKMFWTGTQAAYDALDPWDANFIYHIEE